MGSIQERAPIRNETERKLMDLYHSTIPSLMVELGNLKLKYPRYHPYVEAIGDKMKDETTLMIERAQGTQLGERIARYHHLFHGYILGNCSPEELRAFMREELLIGFDNSTTGMPQPGDRSLIIFNHYGNGREVMGIHGGYGHNLTGHDPAPLVARMWSDEAFAPLGITATRFGRPLYQGDDFYQRSANDFGNKQIPPDNGAHQMGLMFAREWQAGHIPTVCPEAGLRSLRKWPTGAIVSAAIAGAEDVTLVLEPPILTLFRDRFPFRFAGRFAIPDEVRAEVESKQKDGSTILGFGEFLRQQMGRAIVEWNGEGGVEGAYAEAVAAALEEMPVNLRTRVTPEQWAQIPTDYSHTQIA